MIVTALALVLASVATAFTGMGLLGTGALPAALLLFLIAAVLFSAGAIVDALRIVRNDLRQALLAVADHVKSVDRRVAFGLSVTHPDEAWKLGRDDQAAGRRSETTMAPREGA